MKNQKANYFAIGIVILLCFIIFGFSSNYLKKQNQPLPSPVATATNAFDNWKIYTNTKLGIEFKYPSQVLVDQNGNISFQNGEYVIGIVSSTTPETQLYALNPTNMDQVVANMCPKWTDKKSCSDSQPGPIPNSVQFDTLNRHFASTDTIVKNGIVIYDVSLGAVNPNKPISTEAKQIYNKILSTFKFVASTTSTDTSSWTNYVNKTYGYSLKFPVNYERQPGTDEQTTCVRLISTISPCIVLINVYDNKDNLTLDNYLNTKLKSYPIDGPLIPYNFNGYNTLFNKNQPGMYLFIKRGLYVYVFNAPTASSDKEVGDIVTTFKFLPAISYESQKTATVLVQDGSSYGPPFDLNLYQLEISKGNNLFAKSDLVDLKKYLGKTITVNYREVKGVIMGEQQLVTVDSVE